MRPADEVGNNQTSHPAAKNTCWTKFVDWFRQEDKGKWLEDMRGMLSVVSTMIASITFQSSINPPGGVFQADGGITIQELKKCDQDENITCPGEAILPRLYPPLYHRFQVCNTFCFVASLCVTLLLVSGVPLKNRLPIWILSLGMIFTLTSLALTYLYALILITPAEEGSIKDTGTIVSHSIFAWFGIVGIVAVILAIIFLVWLVRKCIKMIKCTSALMCLKELRGRFSQSHV